MRDLGPSVRGGLVRAPCRNSGGREADRREMQADRKKGESEVGRGEEKSLWCGFSSRVLDLARRRLPECCQNEPHSAGTAPGTAVGAHGHEWTLENRHIVARN